MVETPNSFPPIKWARHTLHHPPSPRDARWTFPKVERACEPPLQGYIQPLIAAGTTVTVAAAPAVAYLLGAPGNVPKVEGEEGIPKPAAPFSDGDNSTGSSCSPPEGDTIIEFSCPWLASAPAPPCTKSAYSSSKAGSGRAVWGGHVYGDALLSTDALPPATRETPAAAPPRHVLWRRLQP